jgi:hypothetical protein
MEVDDLTWETWTMWPEVWRRWGRDMGHFTVGAALDITNTSEIATAQIPGHPIG